MELVTLTSSSLNIQRSFTSRPLKSSLISLSKTLLNINTDISSHATINVQFALLTIPPMLTKNTHPPRNELPLLTLLNQKVKGYQEEKCSNDIASNPESKNGGTRTEKCVRCFKSLNLIPKENKEESLPTNWSWSRRCTVSWEPEIQIRRSLRNELNPLKEIQLATQWRNSRKSPRNIKRDSSSILVSSNEQISKHETISFPCS